MALDTWQRIVQRKNREQAQKRFEEERQLIPYNEMVKTNETGLIVRNDIQGEVLNSYDKKFYYITDIHLNHRLIEQFPKMSPLSEVTSYIKEYVIDMLNTATEKGSGDYLLIGGDVSFNFNISKIFYTEVCKLWSPRYIVVVLGNHELWNSDRFGKKATNCTFEEIVEKYRELFSKLKISFLQNSLLIEQENSLEILNEEDILNKTATELRVMTLRSSCVIFGGIGFSAYNNKFNASTGIYKNTLNSLERDLYYTQRSEAVYNKLCDALPLEKLIVLTHTPPSDWSKRELIPAWIYVNGHTHNNNYAQSDKYTVYADNQIGYNSKTVVLKYFKTCYLYDIFKYYSDGIYHISWAQYIEFNNGKKIRFKFTRYVNDIIMLKRQGIYMFLIENKKTKKLFLLDGGSKIRLTVTDVDFYYENMVKYAEFIKRGMKKYNDALKRLSEAIKKIGGEGTIHGCIVDINFYNHVYLNFEDGCITPYHSPISGERYEYPSVEQLLSECLPLLYQNYKNLIETSQPSAETTTPNLLEDTKYIKDLTLYKPSNLAYSLQYVTEKNIIRTWNEDFINNYEKYLEEDNVLLLG